MATPRAAGESDRRTSSPEGNRGPLLAFVLSQVFPLGAFLLMALAIETGEEGWARAILPGATSWEIFPRFAWAVLLYEFLPVTALSFHRFGRERTRLEVERLMDALGLDGTYKGAFFEKRSGYHFLIAVSFASLVTAAGLLLLAFGDMLGDHLIPSAVLVGEEDDPATRIVFPRAGSGLIMGMGFIGAYVWGVLALARRYFLSDLHPGVYYGLSTRMIAAAIIALVIYNAAQALTGADSGEGPTGITAMIWPALAFMIGAFPQRGIQWLSARLPMFRDRKPPRQEAPLEMIQGLTAYDRMRLEEEDIDSCFDLANADLVPLALRTPYSARFLKDWILQAKLCEAFGEGVADLRQRGIRTITDLTEWDEEELRALAKETSLTEAALLKTRAAVVDNRELELLESVVFDMGRFVDRPVPDPGRETGAEGLRERS